jgi:hypothetical protein
MNNNIISQGLINNAMHQTPDTIRPFNEESPSSKSASTSNFQLILSGHSSSPEKDPDTTHGALSKVAPADAKQNEIEASNSIEMQPVVISLLSSNEESQQKPKTVASKAEKVPDYYKPVFDSDYFDFNAEEQEAYRELDNAAKVEFQSSI